jgi:hypothetical protein
MLKVNAECKVRTIRLLQFFPEVLNNRHSSLVLIGAPTQGYRSPLVLARTKCALWNDPSPLLRGGSLTIAYNLRVGSPRSPPGDHRTPIATKLSRWCRSPRVKSIDFHLTKSVAEPPELFQLKCLSPTLKARPHLNRNKTSVPRI